MKTKILCLASSLLMALGFTACSSSDDLPEVQPGQKTTRQIEVKMNKSAVTRTYLNEMADSESPWYWESGDQLVLTDENGKFVCMLTNIKIDENNKNLAEFHGDTEEEVFVGKNYRITYMGRGNSKTFTTSDKDLTFDVDFSKQDGSKDGTGLGTCDAMWNNIVFAKNKNDIYYNEATVVLNKLFSVAHFTLTKETNTDNVTETALAGDNIYKSATVAIGKADGNAPVVTPNNAVTTSSPMILSKLGAKDDFYLTLVPGKNIRPIFRRQYGSEHPAAYGTPGKANELKAGYIYRSGLNGITVPMKYQSLIELEDDIELIPWGEETTGSIVVTK